MPYCQRKHILQFAISKSILPFVKFEEGGFISKWIKDSLDKQGKLNEDGKVSSEAAPLLLSALQGAFYVYG